ALSTSYDESKGKVFFGHGRSPVWREFKDFVSDRLHLPWDEFNRDAVAGLTTFDRLSQMLSSASFAFLVMTAEDEHADKTIHARENVIHEVGLFQGRLGPRRAIILLEEGCNEFTNIVGLSQIRFPRSRPYAAYEEMRRVLEREGLIET
ncbi:MAG: TIR domain-containing protein, partial [Porticoccaceae bacterium]